MIWHLKDNVLLSPVAVTYNKDPLSMVSPKGVWHFGLMPNIYYLLIITIYAFKYMFNVI